MRGRRITHFLIVFIMLVVATVTSCRKDENLDAILKEKSDTIPGKSALGSFLATDGKLKVSLEDTTYVFDAAVDSIAFVKVDTAGKHFFGITAINKDHTISFGISGSGLAASKAKVSIAGGQLLFQLDTLQQSSYLLSKEAHQLDIGKLNLKKYSEEDEEVQAKGTFTTYLSKEITQNAPLFKVTGTFDLKLQ